MDDTNASPKFNSQSDDNNNNTTNWLMDVGDSKPNLPDTHLHYTWNTLKVIALIVLVLGIVIESISLLAYYFAGMSNNDEGSIVVWIGLTLGIVLIILSAYLLVFSQQ